MKALIVFDSLGVDMVIVNGHRISTELKGTNGFIKVYNKKGKLVRVLHYSNVYYIDKRVR